MSETVTIKTVGPVKGPNKGGYFGFPVELEDGRKGEAAGKTDQFRFNPGSVVTMDVVDTEYGVKFRKINAVTAAPEREHGRTPNPPPPESTYHQTPDDRRQKLIVLQSSLKEAVQFHHSAGYNSQQQAEQMQECYNTAEFFAEKILNSDLAK